MAAEDVIRWDEFKELRDEIKSEEASLRSRIDLLTRHKVLFAADFELALDIARNLRWLRGKGNYEEGRLLVETLFERLLVIGRKYQTMNLARHLRHFATLEKTTLNLGKWSVMNL